MCVSFLFGLNNSLKGAVRATRPSPTSLHIQYTKQLHRTAYIAARSIPSAAQPVLRQPSFGCSHQQHSTGHNSRRTAAAMGKPPLTTRRRYHIALGAARQLFAGGDISASGCGALKNHIFDDDGRVAAAVEIYWLNDDGDALRATLRALGGPSWSVETERRINDHYAAYQESVRAHNEAWRRSDIKFVAGMPMLGQKKHPSGG